MTSAPEGTRGSSAGHERFARHQSAAEIMRARAVLLAACSLWVVCGASLDLATHDAIGTGSLTFILIVRFATTVVHVALVYPLFRNPLPSPRVAETLVASVFPITSFALMLIATHQGGLTSPYVTAVFVIVMGQTIAWPQHWRKGAAWAAVSGLVYPVGLLVATRFDDRLAAQLSDKHAIAVFVTYVAVIAAGAIVAVWGGHVMFSLKRSVFESRKLGRYKLLKRIGKGGMGEVWRAEDRALKRSVALKILSPEHGRRPSAIARFEREIQATAQIVHPNVIRIHDWGVTDDGVWYYAMDSLDGADLATVVKRAGPLPPALAMFLFAPAARGLAEAHRHGIVHRDLKPGNMFVVAPENKPHLLELLDFGIARVSDDDAELTVAGAVIGTPGFIAPEVMAGAPATIASDVYGFAATLYFALTGTTPRDANHAPVSALIAGVPEELDDLIVRALDSEPSRRFATADALADDLLKIENPWSGVFEIDRLSIPPSASEDPTVDPEAPATQVEARRAPTM